MAWQFSFYPQQRLALSVLGASLGTLLTAPAFALSFGETVVHSIQNEPLLASIAISDIDPTTFSATLAQDTIYQKMGLSRAATLSATFVPTSSQSGKIVIQSQTPITLPFADVVLDLNHQNQHTLMPKTLLLPLQGRVNLPDDALTMAYDKINDLSSDHSIVAANSKPLLVSHEMPPPLFDSHLPTSSHDINHQDLLVKALATDQSKPLVVLPASLMPKFKPKLNSNPSENLMAKVLQISVTQKIQAASVATAQNSIAQQKDAEPISKSADLTVKVSEQDFNPQLAMQQPLTITESRSSKTSANPIKNHFVPAQDPSNNSFESKNTATQTAIGKPRQNHLKLAAKLDISEVLLSKKFDLETLTMPQTAYDQQKTPPTGFTVALNRFELIAKNN